ncbi:ATP-dependent helicase HrpB [Paenibacillus alvei TS-15]|uniref:ATP-dependent helicase HrpB n=1 Tax=Paenibacillus alvei TS-15 TaxID=1117108 RepID=S9U1B3_PAEAL|nr:ATP-dependent helicase HrpB [Paenibacillus alvei]EPY04340.1 ATP-dependent helicase HrpB [Paenibacillus alvei TS-15]
MSGNHLPIDDVLPELKSALSSHTGAVLVAEPGAGKTTRVPLALLEEPWLQGLRILMLEPRRIAARSAARYMARALGEQAGETVGYRVRLDTCISEKTRIEVITEGILTRMLQEDPSLEGVGLVIFDEFHERHLHADVGLALTAESQSVLREDLRILVMSATLEAESVAAMLGGTPIVVSKGRSYPVETIYAERREDTPLEPRIVRTIMQALHRHEGDIMVFLPGAGEIRRVQTALEQELTKNGWIERAYIAPLYGQLSAAAQDAAISPSTNGMRKIVLATAIAETSLTVEGVRIVIDGGQMRVPRFSPRTGLTRLETVPVSRASADQRRGRAGRLGPGVCYRLWTREEERQLPAHHVPEILAADLASLALELAAWGTEAADLKWLTPPPPAALQQAEELLVQLGALSESGTLTSHGRTLAKLGLHPRFAHMIVKGMELGLGEAACTLASLLEERDVIRHSGSSANSRGGFGQAGQTPAALNPDLGLRMELLTLGTHSPSRHSRQGDVDESVLRRIREQAKQYRMAFRMGQNDKQQVQRNADLTDEDAWSLLAAFAYPDRIAERRSDGRYLLRNGRGAAFTQAAASGTLLAQSPYIVAVQLDDAGTDGRIVLAASLGRAVLERYFASEFTREDLIAWDRTTQSVRAWERVRLGALTLKDMPHSAPDADAVQYALLEGIAQEGLALLPWTKQARQWQARLQFMHRHLPEEWSDASEEALFATLEEWLGPHIYGMRSRDELGKLSLTTVFESMLTWEQRQQLDKEAPTHIAVPSGSRIAVDYQDPDRPLLAVRLQEVFGLHDTPRIAGGRVALTMHLLSPAQRPVQVTQDLASFWATTYFDVKKDLKGRYPKHYWPDNPLEAIATRRTRPAPDKK